MSNLSNDKRFIPIAAWCFYDWASSVFPVIVTTFIFATYFTKSIAENKIIGTYQWGNAISLAGIIIAVASPLFGAIADHSGYHKRWLFAFTLLCVVSTGLLWFSYPNVNSVYFTLACVVVGTVGSEFGVVFYNAFLPSIAPRNYLGRVSGWGWGTGYLGGIIALSIVLVFFIRMQPSWLDKQTAEQVRICGPFAALWYLLFSLPFFYFVPNISDVSQPLPKAIGLGCKELLTTLKKLPREKNILLYLIAHMIYTDGLNTLFAFGGIYAAGTYGLSFQEVLLFGITMNLMSGLGAISLGWVDDVVGSKKAILIALFFITSFGIPILFLQSKYIFWSVTLLLCVFVGPVQSASRSLMARLLSKEASAEMFGLYTLSGKVTAFIGPWIFGLLTVTFNSQRVGMATIMVFFIVGALLLLPVKEAS